MSNIVYHSRTSLTGGGALALDYLDGSNLVDGDIAIVTTGGICYVYRLDAASSVAESSPSVISPDTNAGTKRWILQRTFSNAQNLIDNVSFTATVAAKALTIALKGANGNDPATGNACLIAFRSATLTDGKPVVRSVTSALSVVLSSGSTLGFTSALAGRIYVWAIDNAGTVELALSRTADIFPEGNLVSTTAEGGAGAADSAAVMYSGTARSNVACRCLGYTEITTGGTAGEWDNAPTKIQVMGPGVKRTGDIVQVVNTSTGAVATGTTVLPIDDTIPQNTEGNELMTLAITPTSAINKLAIQSQVCGAHSYGNYMTAALFQDTTASALAASSIEQGNANWLLILTLLHEMIAGTVSATTFKIRAGSDQAGTFTFNGAGGARKFGGVANSFIRIMEVFA